MSVTVLRLHPLVYQPDGEDVVVGRTDVDSYGVFPPDGAELLRRLASGMSLDEAARWYAATYGEPIDIDDFVGVLTELDFLAGPGDDSAPEGEPAGGPAAPVPWQRLGKWLFGPVGWTVFAVLIVAAVVAMMAQPALVPRTAHLFFTPYVTALALTIFLGQLPLILVHEGFHALAGRRLGLRSRLRISRRFYFLVFETSLDGLVVVPRRQRYLPLLAGLLADLVVIAILTLIAAATMRPDGTVPLVGGACLALAYATLIRFGWQFYLFLRTDIYAVVVTVTGCQDLHGAARRIVANRLRRLARRPVVDEAGLHPRDRQIGRWYSWFMLAGYLFSAGVLALAVLPAMWRSFSMAVARFGTAGGEWHQVLDSVVFLTLALSQLGAVAVLWVRSQLRRRRTPATAFLTS